MSHNREIQKIRALLQRFMRELLFLEHGRYGLQIVVNLPNGNKIGAVNMSESMKVGQFEDLAVKETDGVTQFDLPAGTSPTLESSDPTIVGLSLAPDGVSTRATALKAGVATITATVGSFTATDTITVEPGAAIGIVIIPGPVQDAPAAA